MEKNEKLNLIKECITKIEEDIKISDINDKQSLMNKNITECLKIIVSILEENKTESALPPAPQQAESVQENAPQSMPNIIKMATINDIRDEMKRFYGTSIQPELITEWLVDIGLMMTTSKNYRKATAKGEQMGIHSEYIPTVNGKPNHCQTYYTPDGQRFIYSHAEELYAFRNDDFTDTKLRLNRNIQPAFITPEQKSRLKPDGELSVHDISEKINEVTKENNAQKINRIWILNWLKNIGAVKKNAKGEYFSTEYGNSIGLSTIQKTSNEDNSTYLHILCSEKAQHYIYDNAKNIIYYNYTEIKRRKNKQFS